MSTYGSFSYLKYGPLRLFSQLAQDADLKVGRLLYVAGHSGPETAEDSRTHFGIFEPGVMQLFPAGHVIELHPWEYNEVPVLLAAAFRTDAPIVVPAPDPAADRAAGPRGAGHAVAPRGRPRRLRAARSTVPASHAAARSSCAARCPRRTWSALFPELDRRGLNVRVVAAQSEELFRLQDAAYREPSRRTRTAWTRWSSPTAPCA